MGNRGLVRIAAHIVSLVLVVTLLEQVPAAASSGGGSDKRADVPALESEEPAKPELDVPEADFSQQPEPGDDPNDRLGKDKKDYAKSFDATKSKVVKRHAKSDVYLNEDGTHTAVIRTEDVNWQDADGNWHPIDPTIVEDGKGAWKNKSGKVKIHLTGATDDGEFASVQGEGWSVGYRIAGGAPGVKPKVSGRTATYADVLPDMDVEQRVLTAGVKEHVILKKAPASTDDLVLRFPLRLSGVTATAQPDGSIDFVTPGGEAVAFMPPAVVWDAAQAPAGNEGLVESVRLVPDDDGAAVTITVPGAWLHDPSREYPVTIDPSIDAGRATSQYDAFASKPDPNGNYNGARQWDGTAYVDFVGYDNYPTSEQYAYQYFDLTPIMGKTILDATWRDYVYRVRGSGYFRIWRVAASWTDSTITWNNQPGHAGEWKASTATAGDVEYVSMTDWVKNWASGAWASRGISLDTAGLDSGIRFAATEQGAPLNEALFITYNTKPTPGTQTAPADGAMLMTDRPSFTGTTGSDADGNTLSYWFRISTASDGFTGSLLNSGWLTSPSWTPAAGSLVDGTTYYWRMYTYDGTDIVSSGVRSFKVNLRLGQQGVSPMDAMGPVSVNLANGNLNVGVSSRSLDTVGGPVGLSYTYNSKAQQQHGLMGTYTRTGSEATERLVRRDPVLDFNWGTGSPGAGITVDNFDVTWDGYLTVPYQAHNWMFGAVHDDAATITVNNTVVYDAGCCRGFDNPGFDKIISLVSGNTVPITVTLREVTGQANFQLWHSGPITGIVPASWLSTTPPPLPQGWALSVDAGGGELSYSKAVIGNNSLVLHEPSGVVHEYRRQTDQSWKPVDGDDDVVSTATEGGTTVYVVQGADGIVYTFNNKGQLIRAVSATDDSAPAAPRYIYNVATARLDAIEDPVSLKRIELMYAFPPDGGVVIETPCPKNPGVGFNVDPPVGMLCQITYWDGSTTKLYYVGDVQDTRVLARIEDPGGVITDFAYDSNRRLVKIRDPLAVDMVAASLRVNDDTTRTVVTYDASGRVSNVTLPAPLAGDARPGHSYAYASATQTDVTVAGLIQAGTYSLARRVTFDAAGRLLTDRDTAGLVTTHTWDKEDKHISTVEPGGLKTTNVYDHADRMVESHGPAPSSCFGVLPTEPGWSGQRPNTSCNTTGVPVSRTAYDEGIKGLAAEYWKNQNQSGASVAHATAHDGTGALSLNWGTSAPDGVLPQTDNWSGRFTGEIAFPNTGTYSFTVCSDDGVRLFVDDTQIINSWTATASCRNGTVTVSITTANTRKRIRIDHMEATGSAEVSLRWTPPGGSQQVVPGQYLAPRYGLETSSIDADGKKTATEYARPEYGQATAGVTDPDNGSGAVELNLRTVTDYEAPGTGYFRRTRKALPKGNATTFAYYASGEAAPSNQCSGTSAAGMFKSETGPAPATGSAIVRRAVYDSLHRVVGRQVAGDARWSCTTYDSRGRVTSMTDASSKTTTFTYSTPGQVTTTYVDSGGTARSTVEKVDLLGRTWSYTDEHATVTRRTYDQVGRPSAVFRTFSGQPEKEIVRDTYNNEGRLASSTEWLSDAARTTTYAYDGTTGRLTTTTRPNGVTTTTTYDTNRGDVVGLSHAGSAMTTSSWTYTRSAARRVTSEATTGRTRNFAYDAAGRLTQAVEGTTTRNYAYDANTNRCARATSCATPTYTYDNTDRILTSPDYSSYAYDTRGNMTQAVPRTQPAGGSLDQTFTLDPANPSSYEIIAGQTGTVSASLAWTGSAPTYTTQTATGSIAASGTKTTSVPVDGMSYVTADLTWAQGTRTQTTSLSGSVTSSSPSTTTLPVTSTGTISASTDWASSTTSNTWSGTVANLGQDDRTITASANGTISSSLNWPAAVPNPNLDLELLDSSGTVVASSTQLTGNSESVTHNVTGMGAYPATRTYTLRVKAVGAGSSYTLKGTWPVTADVDLELYNPSGTKVAQATGSTAKPESLSYTVTSGNTGNYSLKVLSKNFSASYSGSASYPVLAYADLTLNLKNPSGTVVATTRSSSGAASLTYRAASGGTYTLQLVNNSSDLSVPSISMPWSTTTQGSEAWSGTNVPVSGTRTTSISLDGNGWVTSDLTWTQGTRTQTTSLSGTVTSSSPRITTLPVTSTGTISASTDWASSTTSNTWSGTVANLGQDDRTITASANGTISSSLNWPAAVPNPNLDLELLDSSGTVVASSTQLTGNSESVTHNVTGMGAYPATRTYTLRVKAVGAGSSYTLSGTWPVTADVDLELYNPSDTKVAQATGSSAKPESLSYTVPSGNTGDYLIKVLSKNFSATYTGSATYPEVAHANVTLRLKNPSGTVAATASGSSGSLTLNHLATAGGTWSLELVNNATDLAVPNFSATTRVPRTHTATTLQLKDAAGTVVAQNTSGDNPKGVTTTVDAGRYFLVVTPTNAGTATLTASYPGRPARQVITYDANDHATSVDDGTTLVTERLSPSGRVIRRTVKDVATQDVLEDTHVGYADGGDGAAYATPVAGGAVTTYLGGVIYTGTTASWQLANLHGDVVGTTDAAGVFTATPPTDEFGVGEAPASRLGWLGEHNRFAVGGSLGLIRMGVRLYDPSLGRFTGVDPVEGGSANDYEYCLGDPLNCLDLDGAAQEKQLSAEEREALRARAAGEPYDKRAYRQARRKLTHNQKVQGARNKQKRQSNFSGPRPTREQYLELALRGFGGASLFGQFGARLRRAWRRIGRFLSQGGCERGTLACTR